MSSIYDWNLSADANGDSDKLIIWREHQRPNTVNNSARMMMARIREYLKDIGISCTASMNVVTGTPSYTTIRVRIGSKPTTYTNDIVIRFTINKYYGSIENQGRTTVSINELPAQTVYVATQKGIKTVSGGEFHIDGVYTLVYRSTGQYIGWHLLNPETDPNEFYHEHDLRAPPGIVMPFAADQVPDNWLVCDGGAYSRHIYSDLFHAIGTTWGEGDGSTTFNVPDLRGMFLRGRSENHALAQQQNDMLASHDEHPRDDELIYGEPPKIEPPKPKPVPPKPAPPKPAPPPRPAVPVSPVTPSRPAEVPKSDTPSNPYDMPVPVDADTVRSIVYWAAKNGYWLSRVSREHVDAMNDLRKRLANYIYPVATLDSLRYWAIMNYQNNIEKHLYTITDRRASAILARILRTLRPRHSRTPDLPFGALIRQVKAENIIKDYFFDQHMTRGSGRRRRQADTEDIGQVRNRLQAAVGRGQILIVTSDSNPFAGLEPDRRSYAITRDNECDRRFSYSHSHSNSMQDPKEWYYTVWYSYRSMSGTIPARYPLYTNSVYYFDSDGYVVNPNGGYRLKEYQNKPCNIALAQAKDYTQRVLRAANGYQGVYDDRYRVPCDENEHKAPYAFIRLPRIVAQCSKESDEWRRREEARQEKERREKQQRLDREKQQRLDRERKERLAAAEKLREKLVFRTGNRGRILIVTQDKNVFANKYPDMVKFQKQSDDAECDSRFIFDRRSKEKMDEYPGKWEVLQGRSRGSRPATYPLYTNSMHYFDSEGFIVNPNGGWRLLGYQSEPCKKALAQAKDYTERVLGHSGGYVAVYDDRYLVPCDESEHKAPYKYVKIADILKGCRDQKEDTVEEDKKIEADENLKRQREQQEQQEKQARLSDKEQVEQKLRTRVGDAARILIVTKDADPFKGKYPDTDKWQKRYLDTGEGVDTDCDVRYIFDKDHQTSRASESVAGWGAGLGYEVVYTKGTVPATYPLYTNSLFYFDSDGYVVNPNGGWRIDAYKNTPCPRALAQAKDYTDRVMGHSGGYSAVYDDRYRVPCNATDNKSPYEYVRLPDVLGECKKKQAQDSIDDAKKAEEDAAAARAEQERREKEARERAEAERIAEEKRQQEAREREEAEKRRLEELERERQRKLEEEERERKRQEELRRQQYLAFVEQLKAALVHTHNLVVPNIGGVETRPVNVSVVYAIKI